MQAIKPLSIIEMGNPNLIDQNLVFAAVFHLDGPASFFGLPGNIDIGDLVEFVVIGQHNFHAVDGNTFQRAQGFHTG